MNEYDVSKSYGSLCVLFDSITLGLDTVKIAIPDDKYVRVWNHNVAFMFHK